ncbi:cytochrome P450 [Actinokineospora sp. NBRC 105648]|uniref:cytochrome P450 n=1 Tax=Actinokineospora sp. NBRC 105648 TaxID=3032206 RepID=UPI0024A5166F|nr:cytochrome P450 [Actinokineospora sp. NBRC 105648]GLZ38000.1 cytochrome P450 [Actinokineospora sp. NBRC 105648]
MSLEEVFAFHRQEVGPVRFVESFGGWVATRYADVDRVLTDHAVFSSDELRYSAQPVPHGSNPLLRGLSATDPPRHHVLRRIVSQVFTPRAVSSLATLITARVEGLLAAGGSTFDLVSAVAAPLSVHTVAGLLGVRSSRWPDFVRWTEAITSFFGGFTEDEARQDAFHRALAEMAAYFHEEFERPTGVIAALVAADLTEDELMDFCALLLVNGHETTRTLLVNAVLCLTSRPRPTDVRTTVEEVLRYLPPTGGTDRFVTRPTTLGGQELQPGQRVVAMITAANRDPGVFADPHTFDPDRAVNPHLSFGHGVHFCLGAHLARAQVRTALTALLDRRWEITDLDTHRTPVGIDVLGLTLTTGPRR